MTPRLDRRHIAALLRWGRPLSLLVLCAAVAPAAAASPPAAFCALPAARPAARQQALPATGRLHSLVLFAAFAGDAAAGGPVPAFADSLFDAQLPGSLTHFFDEMSHGLFHLTGAAGPRVYGARDGADTYVSSTAGQPGDYGRFVREIVAAADADIDFGDFDNDGPDGIPDSGDDDGFVDMLFIVVARTPSGFLVSDANGLALLGTSAPLTTGDASTRGGRVLIRGDGDPQSPPGGTIQRGRTFADAAGIIAHEFGHVLGLPDLFDTGFAVQGGTLGPEDDSAGIGYWGLMAHGARGWDDLGGPTPLSAWSLAQLGWLGADNDKLRVLERSQQNVRFEDSNAGGLVYRLDMGEGEYLLVEHRRAAGSYYDRRIPADGLLIWHVDEGVGGNDDEKRKLVDLVSADGRFTDAGYPLGIGASPVGGGDNLDFWAHDEAYRTAHAGNLGDATDPFDGERFTAFSPVSNPASRRVAVENIRRDGRAMIADLVLNDRRRAGVLVTEEIWSGTIDVVADVVVPEGGRLRIRAGTTVRFASDHRRAGLDPQRSELLVRGLLSVGGGATVNFTSAASSPAPGDWAGIRVEPLGEISLLDAVVEYAADALRIVDVRGGILLDGVTVRQASGDALVIDADEGSHLFKDLRIEQVGGTGLWLRGTAPMKLQRPQVSLCGGAGLRREEGFIACSDGVFLDNGTATGAANIELGRKVFGPVSGNTLRGGTGLAAVGAGQVRIEDNLFTHNRVALRHRDSRAWITGNTIASSDTAFILAGSALPVRLELNRISDAQILVDNRSVLEALAINNWWGTDEAASIAARVRGPVRFEPFLNFDPRAPVSFTIGPVFPNPATGTVTIPYTVGIGEVSVGADSRRTVVEIRNVLGARVRRLVDEEAAPGIYRVGWDGRGDDGRLAAAGLYYAQLDVGGLILFAPLLRLR